MSAGEIRPLAAADLPALATLRRLSFRHSHQPTDDALARYLGEVFLEHPWRDTGLQSLVWAGARGEVLGFLGVIPRRYHLRGERLTAAVLSHFMVHPEARGGGIGRRLMAHYLAGPQDLAWSDVANDATRAVWTANGGFTATLHSLYWRRTLRPARSGGYALARGPLGRAAYMALRPAAAAFDALAARAPGGALAPLEGSAAPLPVEEAPALLRTLDATRALGAEWAPGDLAWVAGHLARNPQLGALASTVVSDSSGAAVGWYLWGRRGGTASVVRVAARPGQLPLVLAHLEREAWGAGAVALEGRLEPGRVEELARRGAVLTREGPWVMAHTRRADVRDALLAGDSDLSRLDGEWWLAA